MFSENNVTVLKMGLHSDSNSVAGPFHPAFGELVRSQLFYNEITEIILKGQKYLIEVAPGFISIANGNKNKNLIKFKNEGYDIVFKQNANLQKYEYKINNL